MSISVQEIPFNLTAGQQLPVALNGRYLFLRQSSADIELRLTDGGSFFTVSEGEAYDLTDQGAAVEKFTIRNARQHPVSGTIILSNAKVSRWIASTVKVRSGSASISNALDILVGDSAMLIADSDKDRSKITIFAGKAPLWVGGSAALAADTVGGRIPANGSAVIDTRGAIYGIRSAGDSTNAGYLEESL